MRIPSAVTALLCLVGASCCVGVTACSKSTPEPSSTAAGPKPASPAEARQLVAKLRALPPAERAGFVSQHPGMAEGVNQSGDASLMNEFLTLMRDAGPK